MKKYLYLLTVPLLLTACFNDDEAVTAPEAEDPVVEESVEESETDSNDADGETNTDAETDEQGQDQDQDEAEDQDNDEANEGADSEDDEESDSSSDLGSNTSQTSTDTSQASDGDGQSASEVTENQESEAIDAVVEHAELDQDNLIFLTHLEDDGIWLQVEVREEIPNQNHTNLVALYRQNLETGDLEAFDFIIGEYQPVT